MPVIYECEYICENKNECPVPKKLSEQIKQKLENIASKSVFAMNKEMVGKDKPFCLTSRLLLGPRPKTCPVGNTTRLVTSTFHSSQDMMVGLGQSGDPT